MTKIAHLSPSHKRDEVEKGRRYSSTMRIYLDSTDFDEIKRARELPFPSSGHE
jgi:hypothetical protein